MKNTIMLEAGLRSPNQDDEEDSAPLIVVVGGVIQHHRSTHFDVEDGKGPKHGR